MILWAVGRYLSVFSSWVLIWTFYRHYIYHRITMLEHASLPWVKTEMVAVLGLFYCRFADSAGNTVAAGFAHRSVAVSIAISLYWLRETGFGGCYSVAPWVCSVSNYWNPGWPDVLGLYLHQYLSALVFEPYCLTS